MPAHKGGRLGHQLGFKKGQSGNPGGRKKIPAEVLEAARAYTLEAIETLAKWMRSEHASAAPASAIALLNRGWGLPAQSVKISGSLEHKHATELTEAELERIASGGSAGAANEGEGSTQPPDLH